MRILDRKTFISVGLPLVSALALLAQLALPSALPPSIAGDLAGRAGVIDGDTIEIGGERIRLAGVDAPEVRQRCLDASGLAYACGRLAAVALADYLAASRPTVCRRMGRDGFGRTVATCRRADGGDAGAFLVRRGHAVDWRRYSKGRYAIEQAAARSEGAGLWQGDFDMPWDWRRKARGPRAGKIRVERFDPAHVPHPTTLPSPGAFVGEGDSFPRFEADPEKEMDDAGTI